MTIINQIIILNEIFLYFIIAFLIKTSTFLVNKMLIFIFEFWFLSIDLSSTIKN